MALLAYFISFHTYGSWLHGHQRGSVDDEHNTPSTPFAPPSDAREHYRRNQLQHDPTTLSPQRRWVVDRTIREVCLHRAWALRALNVRTTHVHCVISGAATPEKIMIDLKAWCTRRMRESGVLGSSEHAWSEHGSTKYLDTETSLQRAIHYVLHEQGPDLPMVAPRT